MKTKLALTFALVAITLVLCAGCSQVPVEVSCDDFTKQHNITKEVKVAVGDSFTVTLCSNPTTGFEWSESAQISNQHVLEQTAHEFTPPEGDTPGAAGEETWIFEALEKGTTEVTMEYSRLWEGGEKGEWTFVLTVVVK